MFLGLMIDTVSAEPVLIEKHGLGMVVGPVEECERAMDTTNSEGTQSDHAQAIR